MKDSDPEGGEKCKIHLYRKPCGAEEIAYGKAQHHAGHSGGILSGKTFHEKTLDQREKQKSCQVSAGGAGKFCQPAAEGGKYRKSGGARQR